MNSRMDSVKTSREELAQWVVLCQNGDKSAFEQIFRNTEALTRKLAYSVLGEHYLEDAIQESYLLVFSKIRQLREPKAFLAWLTRLVLHTSYKLAKKNKVHNQLPPEISDQEREKDQTMSALTLRHALSKLNRQDRDILVLRELLSLSYEEVGFALDVPVGTVRSRLHSARKKLEARLKLDKG